MSKGKISRIVLVLCAFIMVSCIIAPGGDARAQNNKNAPRTMNEAMEAVNRDTAARTAASANARERAHSQENADRIRTLRAYSDSRTDWTGMFSNFRAQDDAQNAGALMPSATPAPNARPKGAIPPPDGALYRYDPEKVRKERTGLPKLFNAPVQ